jgi:FkbM family methyltransferase
MTWQHKGYWYFGSSREAHELERFKESIIGGDCVLEVGGHIGYLTQIFEDLVGETGMVYVAEPTPSTRRFLEKNVALSTCVIPAAISDFSGVMDFFIEDFGGFTNSLDGEFTKENAINLGSSQLKSTTKVSRISVEVTTIDSICREEKIAPQFIKIDVEGAELSVLKGAENTLRSVRSLMVEISRDHEEVFKLLYNKGFTGRKACGGLLLLDEVVSGNVFFSRELA